jgi:predicted metal-dependent peptidase
MDDLDIPHLTKELDRAKSGVFLGNNAAFLGSLMCSMNFHWDRSVPTAATDGVNLYWNPDWFLSLKPEARKTVLVHELWHPARLHFHRQGTRDPKIWNYATDIRINNELTAEGYSFDGIEGCWRDTKYPPGMPEEDIYDDLMKNQTPPPPQGGWGQPPPPCNGGNGGSEPGGPNPDSGCDMLPADKGTSATAINNVVRAIHQAKLGGGAGTIPGDVELLISKFLSPVLPWELLLNQFMQDLIQEEYTWRQPNRRFPDMYLPSRYQDEGKLTHLIYYEDVSGSISDVDCLRFNSEVKHVKDTFQPSKMTLVQFDTRITQEIVFYDDDPFDQIKILGRGGTSLVPVRAHILHHRPTAAIIFSDLDCAPMEPLGLDIPILWICIRNGKAKVPFGKLIHIR